MVKSRMIDGKQNIRNKKNQKNLYHVPCKNYSVKGNYAGNSEFSTQTNLKEYVEEIKKIKQVKFGNKPPGGEGEQNILVNHEDVS